MKPYQRRQQGNFPYYKLAAWDARSFTFRDGKQAFASRELALAAVPGPGKYRVSKVTAEGRVDEAPFNVGVEKVTGLSLADAADYALRWVEFPSAISGLVAQLAAANGLDARKLMDAVHSAAGVS